MEETYEIDDIDALLEELGGIAEELSGQILSNCPHKDINCIIGQLKGFYYNLNDNNLLTTINKHISPKITKEELLSFGEPDEVLCIDR